LAPKFGKANLFIDVDNLLAGQRFDEELAKALAACDVLIAVIGQHWMELLKAKITSGGRDPAGLQNLVAAMRTRGYGERLIEKICFRNWLRVLGQTWEKPD
jgi:microsomal dipeptidase-like Zn-dependent dipeptidase